MAGSAVSYQFLDALAKSVGMDAETVKQALAEINQLQQQTQELEAAVQGKAPTNHASQQAIFGTANEQMYGHVKIAHEVSNDSTDGVAVSPDAVYAYAPDRNTTPKGLVTYPSASGIVDGEEVELPSVFSQINGNAISVCWHLANPSSVNAITIMPVHNFVAIDTTLLLTNSGLRINVRYDVKNAALNIVPSEDGLKEYDSLLIFLKPSNV